MSTNHAVTHTHAHEHRRPHPHAQGHSTWVTHEHEHDHSSLHASYATEGNPPHRMHFHAPRNDPRKVRR